MFARRCIASALLLGLVVLLSCSNGDAAEPGQAEQIAAIEKQIADLNAKLAALKAAPAPAGPALPEAWGKALSWRGIGPASMGGRIVAFAVNPADPTTFWIATASGGLLKTTNNGTTFTHQFDREGSVSIGDVAVAPSDPNVVWVGTGENNPRNSVSYGDGVYKSTDGGKSWKNMGLGKTFQVGRVVIHPKNPDVVYVGALGRLYGPNPERGLFKTTDGGKTWNKILHVDDDTGVIEMKMHPTEPDTLLVATWERRRDGFDSHAGALAGQFSGSDKIDPPIADGYDAYDPIRKWGKGGAIYKTTDGGKTFRKLAKGLPTCKLGRVGLDYCLKKPNVVVAVIDTEKIGSGQVPGYLGISISEDGGPAKITDVTKDTPAEKAGLKAGDVVLSVDKAAVKNGEALGKAIGGRKPGDKLALELKRADKPLAITVELGKRGGAANTRPYGFLYGGQRENVQAQQGPDGHEYGGVYRSEDGGETWARVNSVNPRPMYFSQIRIDPSDDQLVYLLGVFLYRSTDGGKTFRPGGDSGVHPDHHAMWINPRDGRHILIGTDGGTYVTYDRGNKWDYMNHAAVGQFYHVAVDSRRPYRVYGGMQDNGSWGGPSRGLDGKGPINADWSLILGGDGFVCRVDPTDPDIVYTESQEGNMVRTNLKTGEQAGIQPRTEKGKTRLRYNWNAPMVVSSHNPAVFYSAGNFVHRSIKRGEEPKVISPELTKNMQASATALAESPKSADVLWAGTDDGKIWVTRDGGKEWAEVSANVKLPKPFYVATLEPSRTVEGRCYVCFDGHRSDDDDPHVYVTEDFGKTWKSLRGNLPAGSSRCLREDILNPDVLYLGTEFAAWASIDRGASWTKINANLPTVAIHELAQHPTSGDLIAATHGRSIWICDISPVRQLTPAKAKAAATLLAPAIATRWRQDPRRGTVYGTGHREYFGDNGPQGAQIYYAMTAKAKSVTLSVQDFAGKSLASLPVKNEPGLHRATWNMRGNATPAGINLTPPTGLFGAIGRASLPVPPGKYRIVLSVDGKDQVVGLEVENDPRLPAKAIIAEPVTPAEEREKRDD